LHVLGSICRGHRAERRAVRRAVAYLGKEFQSDHPLLDRRMLTDGTDLLLKRYGELVTIPQDGQMAMKVILEAYLDRIDRDDRGIPVRLYPFSRKRVETSPKLVAIDPRICFGKPCISGTRIPTAIIAERLEAGDSVALLAEDYGRRPEEIEEAVRYELSAGAPGKWPVAACAPLGVGYGEF
jgi:uncharacterized protein (DUF433 family)